MAKLQNKPVAEPQGAGNLPALDVDFLNAATFNDIPLRAEIIILFRQQVKTLADQLSVSVDPRSWAYLTHTLKGSASAVGAKQLAALADQWETAACPESVAARLALSDNLAKAMAAFNAIADTLRHG